MDEKRKVVVLPEGPSARMVAAAWRRPSAWYIRKHTVK
jgi:hypothetical protein